MINWISCLFFAILYFADLVPCRAKSQQISGLTVQRAQKNLSSCLCFSLNDLKHRKEMEIY